MKYLQYLIYLFRHKWYVFRECRKLGMFWCGVFHDLSKFMPSEFFAYAEYFYGGWNCGYPASVKRAYEFAWLKHIKRNPHHWQWWILGMREGNLDIFDMPERYWKEMVADWRGMAWVKSIQGTNSWEIKDKTRQWYLSNKDKMKLSPLTRASIERELGI